MYNDNLSLINGCTILMYNKTGKDKNWLTVGCSKLNKVICQLSNNFPVNKSQNLTCSPTHNEKLTTDSATSTVFYTSIDTTTTTIPITASSTITNTVGNTKELSTVIHTSILLKWFY